MVDMAVLQALDAAETSGVAATLAGLSISASSFLMNLAKSKADVAAEAMRQWKAAEKDVQDSASGADRNTFEQAARLKKNKYLAMKVIADDAAGAMKKLLYAFACFATCLVETMTLDPIVDKQTLEGAATFAGYTYEQLLPVDVVLSGSAFAAGVFLLCMSARAIFKIIPKIE